MKADWFILNDTPPNERALKELATNQDTVIINVSELTDVYIDYLDRTLPRFHKEQIELGSRIAMMRHLAQVAGVFEEQTELRFLSQVVAFIRDLKNRNLESLLDLDWQLQDDQENNLP